MHEGLPLTSEDFMALAFTPVMASTLTQAEKITRAVDLSCNIPDHEARTNVQAILYAFASKFLRGNDLNKIKEMIRMTELGQMIYEDGIIKGREEGEHQKSLYVVKRALEQGLDIQLIADLTEMTSTEIEELCIKFAQDEDN